MQNELSIAVALASLLVIGLSTFLQYISHRHEVVDTRFEREQKIKKNLGSKRMEVAEFTQESFDIAVRVGFVDVRERSGVAYRAKKLLWPFGSIEGTTVVKMDLHPDSDIPLGLYRVEGLESIDKNGLRGIVGVVPEDTERDFVTLEIDTVDPYEVPPTLSNNMNFTEDISLVDMTNSHQDAEEFGILMQELSTPTNQPYHPEGD